MLIVYGGENFWFILCRLCRYDFEMFFAIWCLFWRIYRTEFVRKIRKEVSGIALMNIMI